MEECDFMRKDAISEKKMIGIFIMNKALIAKKISA